MRTRTYYHGTYGGDLDPTQDNPVVDRYDLCMTDERDIAQEYAEQGEDSKVYEITIDRSECSLADEEEAEEIVKDVYGIDSLEGMWLFEYLDDPRVMAAIVDAGFDGVDFVDQSPVGYKQHDTVRLYKPDAIFDWKQTS